MSTTAPKLKLTVGALPYSDGSGDQMTAIIERCDEGVMLRIDMTHRVPIEKWSTVRDTINELVQSAFKMMNQGQ